LTPIFGVIFRPSGTEKFANFRSPRPTPDPTPGSGSRGAIFRGFRGFQRKTRPKPRIRPKTGISGPEPKNRSRPQKSGFRPKTGVFPENPPGPPENPISGPILDHPRGNPKIGPGGNFRGFGGFPRKTRPKPGIRPKTRISDPDPRIGFPPKPGSRPKTRPPRV